MEIASLTMANAASAMRLGEIPGIGVEGGFYVGKF